MLEYLKSSLKEFEELRFTYIEDLINHEENDKNPNINFLKWLCMPQQIKYPPFSPSISCKFGKDSCTTLKILKQISHYGSENGYSLVILDSGEPKISSCQLWRVDDYDKIKFDFYEEGCSYKGSLSEFMKDRDNWIIENTSNNKN